MAEEVSKYYWIKLKNTFLTSRAVDFLMSQPNGAQYVVLYQSLCLNTINTNGELASIVGEVIIKYDTAKIQRDCKWFSEDTILVALELYKKLGLIYKQNNGILRITNFESLIGGESKWAEYKREERSKKQIGQCPSDVQQDIRYLDIKDKRIENREKEILKEKENSSELNAQPSQIVISLPALKQNFDVTKEFCKELQDLYQAVDVETELKKMKGWLISSPKNRKSNTKKFITSWLARAQDQARKSGVTNGSTEKEVNFDDEFKDWDKMQLQIMQQK